MLNKPVGMRFIIADTTALLHMGRGDFVLPVPFREGILSGGIMSRGILSVSHPVDIVNKDEGVQKGLFIITHP